MRWLALLVAGCSSSATVGTGTIVYSEAATGNIRTLDVATGENRLIDPGRLGGVSISIDKQHVAYQDQRNYIRVADMHGTITFLKPRNACSGGENTWGPGSSLTYCHPDAPGDFVAFVPSVGAETRKLPAGPAISSDGRLIAYKVRVTADGAGDLVVENADGSDHRVLVSNVVGYEYPLFTPDDRYVVAGNTTDGEQLISVAEGTKTSLGPGVVPWSLHADRRRQLLFSPDGTELLELRDDELLAVNLMTAESRHLGNVPLTPRTAVAEVAFVDRDHVVFTLHRDTTPPGSDLGSSLDSVHLVGADGSDVALVPEQGWLCEVPGVAPDRSYVVTNCDRIRIQAIDGSTLASVDMFDVMDVIGISGDSEGAFIVHRDDQGGRLSLLSRTGSLHDLDAAVGASEVEFPYAAYAP